MVVKKVVSYPFRRRRRQDIPRKLSKFETKFAELIFMIIMQLLLLGTKKEEEEMEQTNHVIRVAFQLDVSG